MGALQWAVDTAKELLDEFGKTVSFYRETPDDSDNASMPWKPDGIYPDVPPLYSCIGMTAEYEEKLIDGTVIQRGDIRCYVAAKGFAFVPKAGDNLKFSNTVYKVMNVGILEPGVDRVLYDLQLRG